MKLDEYIFSQMLSFEAETHPRNNDGYLRDNIVLRKKILKKMLNEEQLKAFKDYNFAIAQYFTAQKSEYFTEGFMRGFFTPENAIPDDN